MDIHEHQRTILAKLVRGKGLRFNELLIEGLESEHMNYHLKKVVDAGLVTKTGQSYELTDKGKDVMNLFDDAFKAVEKQPKTGVILSIVRFNKKKGKIENLLNKRLRHPYFGKVGRAGGKVQFGETLEQAAARELLEETGLTAKTLTLQQIHHKIRSREDGTIVQDVIFYIFHIKDVSGTLKAHGVFEENFWATHDEVIGKMDIFDDFEFNENIEPKPLKFTESVGIADGF